MATYFAKASFKTGLGQREFVEDLKASSKLELHVGDVFHINNGNVVARTNTTSGAAAVETVAEGDYIVAQSDMSMEYGHIKVEDRDYRYSDKVELGTTPKKVAFFKITDINDIVKTYRTVQ